MGNDFFFGNVHVVAFVSLCCRRDDRLGETLVLAHSIRQFYTTDLTYTFFVVTPSRTGEDGTDNHLHTESLALQSHGHHRVGGGQLPVGTYVCRCVKEFSCYLIEYLSLERNTFGQDHVKGRDSVSSDHHEQVVVDVIHVAHLSMVHALLSIKMEIGIC